MNILEDINALVRCKNDVLIGGFIRETLDEMNYIYLPQLIIKMCMTFLKNVDEWDRVRVHFTINVDAFCITQKHSWGSRAAYLSNIVGVGIHVWKFHIWIAKGYMEIGIKPEKSKYHIRHSLSHKRSQRLTYYQSFHTEMRLRGFVKIHSGDIVHMKLDLNELSVSFYKNCSFITKLKIHSTKYVAGVTLNRAGSKVVLSAYQHFYK